MILWIVKLLSSIRRAIAGRKYPHQLAWAVAFGLLLGVVPHGNLLALVLLIVVLSLKINHAMAGLTAVGATFVATRLDPYSHQVGDFVLSHPQIAEKASAAWQLPLMPWTDLNNTVVLGSFLIGVAALVPVFVITYPVFRLFAPSSKSKTADSKSKSSGDLGHASAAEPNDLRQPDSSAHQVVLVDHGHVQVPPPHSASRGEAEREVQHGVTAQIAQAESEEQVDFVEIDDDSKEQNKVAVETRIDVIRMKDHLDSAKQNGPQQDDAADDPQPMDEALNYLLRQLRDSQQRKAA